MDMKWKKSYSIAFGIAIVFLSPLGVYFVHHMIIDIRYISSNPQSWAAFGGMYYGLVIAGLTGFNIWLLYHQGKESNRLSQRIAANAASREKALSLSRYLEELIEINFELDQVLTKGHFIKSVKIYKDLSKFEKNKIGLFEYKDAKDKFFDFATKFKFYHNNRVYVRRSMSLLPGSNLDETLLKIKVSKKDYQKAKELADELPQLYEDMIEALQIEIEEKFHFHI